MILSRPWRAACLALTLAASSVSAAEYGSSPIQFGNGSISFGTSGFNFSSSVIVFPSQPIQTETAATIEVTLPSDILFDFDKADLRPMAQQALQELAQLVREKSRGPVTIQGHTDSMGGEAYNQRLSERRAAAVKSWLESKGSLPTVRFATTGFGAKNPVAPNRKADGSDDPLGRQLNRRVTIIIRK